MADEGGSVTLVFYKVGAGMDLYKEPIKEPFLNLLAAAFQMIVIVHARRDCHRKQGRVHGADEQRVPHIQR